MPPILILAAQFSLVRPSDVAEIQMPTNCSAAVGRRRGEHSFCRCAACFGQKLDLTGTLAGQIVMEGFLNIRIHRGCGV
jgi:Mn2+/Fe2+ NRAMP family transporter